MAYFDLSLIKAPYGTGKAANASLAGIPFRIDPESVSLPIQAKVFKQPTLGGMVVQVYGVTWGDLSITGSFGKAGWQGQANFLDQMVKIGRQAAQQNPAVAAGQNFSPGGPVRFIYPLLNWDFHVYLKGYTSPDGPAVVYSNNVVNPKYTLTLFIDQEFGKIKEVAQNAYIQRLAEGLGVMWNVSQNTYTGYAQDQYNAPTDATLTQQVLKAGGVTVSTPSTPSNFTGGSSGAPLTTPGGSTSSVGIVTSSGNYSINSMNDFSIALLSALNITPTTLDLQMINAWQTQEGQWGAYVSAYQAMNMNNPLNLNPGFQGAGSYDGFPATGLDGTISFNGNWDNGVTATANTITSGHPGILTALQDSSLSEFFSYSGVDTWNPNQTPPYWQTVQSTYNRLYGS